MYDIFLQSQDLEMKSNVYWCTKLGLSENDLKAWFKVNFTNDYLPRKVKDFNWKLFHGLIHTESRLKRMNYSDGICKMCNSGQIENLEHLLFGCTHNRQVWEKMERIIQSSIDKGFIANVKEVIAVFFGLLIYHMILW